MAAMGHAMRLGATTSHQAIPMAPPVLRCPLVSAPHMTANVEQHGSRGQLRQASAAHIRPPAPSVACRGQPGLVNLPLDKPLEEPLQGFDSIASALEDLAAGKFVVVLDDENRENEGDLIISADKVTTEAMHFMVEYTSGVICISMEGPDLDRLKLPLMISSAENEEAMYTAFTVTVDLKDGITTGISASDRAKTIRHLANPAATAAEFRRPGHIFPLRYRKGGVLVRPGHTEAGVDLARLAGSYPAGVLCEIVNKADGSMARTPELVQFAKAHGLKCITIADLIRYRLQHEQLVARQGPAATLESSVYGPLTVQSYRCDLDDAEHVAYVAGALPSQAQQAQQPVPVYIHQEACVGDVVLAGQGPAAGLHAALAHIAAAGAGVVLYMRPRLDGPPSLASELAAPAGSKGSRMDIRVFGLATQMLKDLGVAHVAVVGGDETQATALRSCGLTVHPAPRSPAPAAVPQLHVNGANGVRAASLNGTHTLAGVR